MTAAFWPCWSLLQPSTVRPLTITFVAPPDTNAYLEPLALMTAPASKMKVSGRSGVPPCSSFTPSL